MKIKKGEKIIVHHNRKGTFNAIAANDFDTEKDEFFDVVLDDDLLEGLADDWYKGQHIPCRSEFCSIEKSR